MRFVGILMLMLLVAEILSLLLMVKWLGLMLTLVLMILSFMAGSYLLRGKGNLAKVLMGGELLRGAGRVSLYQMLWPVRIPFAGLLLMLPGFFSSLLALLLLLPFKGKPLATGGGRASGSFGAFHYQTHTGRSREDDDVIEGEFVVRGQDGGKRRDDVDVIEHKK